MEINGADIAEITASDLAAMIVEGESTTIEQGIPEGVGILDAWFFEGVVYLRLDREI